MNRERIDRCVERLCEKGCQAVWGDIAALEGGDPLPEIRDLSPMEVSAVIAELKQIMSVYEGSCGVPKASAGDRPHAPAASAATRASR